MLSRILQEHVFVDVGKIRAKQFIADQLALSDSKAAKVEQNHGWKHIAKCPLCRSSEKEELLRKGSSALVGCQGCNLRYMTRQPRDLNDVYNDQQYTLSTKEYDKEHFEYRKSRFGKERVAFLEKHCGCLKEKKILDIGCGNGFFLAAVSEVCDHCVGSEFSTEIRRQARKNTGVPVYGELLAEFPERDFDIVTAFNVVEHVPAPLDFGRDIMQLLKPDGYVYVYTPNYDSLSIRVLKDLSPLIDVTEHPMLFTADSLEHFGSMLGLQVVHMETRGLDVNTIISFLDHIGEPTGLFLEKWGNEVQAVIDASGAAEGLRMLFRKTLDSQEVSNVEENRI